MGPYRQNAKPVHSKPSLRVRLLCWYRGHWPTTNWMPNPDRPGEVYRTCMCGKVELRGRLEPFRDHSEWVRLIDADGNEMGAFSSDYELRFD